MDGQGMSLFNGAGSIHLNTSSQRIEEEEELEDQKRRNKELQNELQKGFDDFIDDDDDESVNDSAIFASMISTRSRNHSKIGAPKSPENLHTELCKMKNAHLNEPVLLNYEKKPEKFYHNSDITDLNYYEYKSPYYNSDQTEQAGTDLQTNDHFQHCHKAATGGVFENLQHLQGQEFLPPNVRHQDDQLQSLYELRVREVQKLGDELTACRRDATAAHDVLYGRLAVAEAERERAQLSLQQSQELVANSKHRITELEHQVSTLNGKVNSLLSRNDELNAEVTATTASLMDAQHRLQAAKLNKESTQSTDALFKAHQERYKEDTDRLEKDLTRTRKKLVDKENEYLVLEKRYISLERLKEDLLVEKGSTINKLAMELEEAQKRLAGSETVELKEKISHLIVERNTARHQFKDMAGKLEATATELVDSRTKLIRIQEDMSELESVLEQMAEDRESDSFTQMKSVKTGFGFSSQSDKVALLRNELTRSVIAQKMKREQINKLNKSLLQKDKLIESLKDAESVLKNKIQESEKNEIKLTSDLKVIQNQMDLLKSNANPDLIAGLKTHCTELEETLKISKTEISCLRSKNSELEAKYEAISSKVEHRKSLDKHTNADLLQEHDKLTYQLKDAWKQIDELKNMYVEVCGAKEKLLKEIDELKSSEVYQDVKEQRTIIEDLQSQLENEKNKVDKLGKHLLEQQMQEFDGHIKKYKQEMEEIEENTKRKNSFMKKQLDNQKDLEEEHEKLKKITEDQREQLSALGLELEESKQIIKRLNSEVELQGERETLIGDLKDKAKQFEHYILTQQAKLLNRKDACTSPERIDYSDKSSPNSNKEQSPPTDSQYFQIEESVRMEFEKRMKTVEMIYTEKVNELEQHYNSNLVQLSDILKVKSKEVTMLQSVVLAERIKMDEILANQSKNSKKVDDEKLHNECREQVDKYQKQINKLNSEIEGLILLQQSTAEVKELRMKLATSTKELEKLKDKYKTIKKTATKYKEYITEKDKHVESEILRIKQNYEESMRRMQQRLDLCINRKDQQISSTISEIDTQYAEKISKLQNGKKQQVS